MKISDIIALILLVGIVYWLIAPYLNNKKEIKKIENIDIKPVESQSDNELSLYKEKIISQLGISEKDFNNLTPEEFDACLKALKSTEEILGGVQQSSSKMTVKQTLINIVIFLAVLFFYIVSSVPDFIPNIINLISANNLNTLMPQIASNKELGLSKTFNFSDLQINPMTEYDYKTKSEIYALRKKYVAQSIFATQNYEPNEELFGQIQDGKPWYGADSTPCQKNPINGGVSKRSKCINNPTLLIDVTNELGYPDDSQNAMCYHQDVWQLMVKKLSYSKQQNVITAIYEVDNTFLNNNNRDVHPFLQLGGLNARDFGYNCGYLFNAKNIQFKSSPNIMTDVYQFRDFIHTGGSCGLPGGCNNQSPFQPELEFNITNLPATMTFKLWKKYPNSKNTSGDIYYKILIKDKNS